MPNAGPNSEHPRHAVLVRITHWLTVLAFLALLVTGIEILISHPRFYWGESGNSGTTPLFSLHIPSSRSTVPSGYNYILPDQNGWSRYLHFQAAWAAVLTGLLYLIYGFTSGHFLRNLVPIPAERNWRSIRAVLTSYLRRTPLPANTYNVLQRLAYLAVIFILFPFMVWTGLAMSPSFCAAFPFTVDILGGRQSARTLHFFATDALVLFVIVHVAMVIHAGFKSRMRAMTIGAPTASPTHEAPEPAVQEPA